ncbi:MAG: helix-turn-helix domain-containing protein [Clostridiales bacterium]|nr:MAG: helix-turn-helix domain-containing protein [Clostridiales bacterium]
MFKEVTNLTPHGYLTKIRLDKACYLLSNTNLNVSEISDMTGFADPLLFQPSFSQKNPAHLIADTDM